MTSEHKTIPGFSNYQINREGEVISSMRGSPKRLKPNARRHGYLAVALSDGKIQKAFSIHRLVAITFIPNPENKPCVNHINGIKTDNRAVNLEWCTQSENAKHSFRIGTQSNKGERHPSRILTAQQAKEIRELALSGLPQKEIGEKYGVTFYTVSKIKHGKLWR